MASDLALPGDYAVLLGELKDRIRSAQTRAVLAVNRELVLLYWHIGQAILGRQAQAGWERRSCSSFPATWGGSSLSSRGWVPATFSTWRSARQRGGAWQSCNSLFRNCPGAITSPSCKKDPGAREWYARATTNFERALPAPQAELARQMLKDPYNFDFLNLGQDALERELERGLIAHLRDFMLELGVGFAFVGSQVHLEVGGEDFYLDLLFYHLRLRCYVVIDLKIGEFKPEYVGKMNFYLSAADDLLRHPNDAPSIGLLLCRMQNKVTTEYALRGVDRPLGVSTYELAEALPQELRGQLPSVEELERELKGLGGQPGGENSSGGARGA